MNVSFVFKSLILLWLLGLCSSCYQETFIPVKASFDAQFRNGNETIPAYIDIENKSSGGEHYLWEFSRGTPATSTEKAPEVLYTKHGSYKIKLTVTNEYGEQDTKEQIISIKDAIKNIGFVANILKNNFAPAQVQFTNHTQGENFS